MSERGHFGGGEKAKNTQVRKETKKTKETFKPFVSDAWQDTSAFNKNGPVWKRKGLKKEMAVIIELPKVRGVQQKGGSQKIVSHFSKEYGLNLFFRNGRKHPRIYCHIFIATLHGERSGPSVWPPRLNNPEKREMLSHIECYLKD